MNLREKYARVFAKIGADEKVSKVSLAEYLLGRIEALLGETRIESAVIGSGGKSLTGLVSNTRAIAELQDVLSEIGASLQ